MNKIAFPLTQGVQSAAVTDLQDALQQLLDWQLILANDEAARRALSEALAPERADQTFGGATGRLVGIFQDERGLRANGEVDEPTAEALNALLNEWGLLDRTDAPRASVVSGLVQREDLLPVQDARVHAVHEADGGAIRLGEDTTDAEGRYTIRYERLPGVDGINLRVTVTDADGQLLGSSDVLRNARPLEIIDVTVPMDLRPATRRRIEGQILLQHGLPAEQLRLLLYRLDFGGKTTLLGETTTRAGGQYAFIYDPGGSKVSLEVRAVTAANEEITLSKPLNEISGESRTVVNLVAPGDLQPLAAEYRRLSADLAPHLGQMSDLADARENGERQDLTVLNRATGWDARLIALAITTERLSADAEVKLPQECVYGLLRAGLPSDKLMLAQVEPEVVEQSLKTVREAGIVDLTDQQIGDFKTQFAAFATQVRLNIPAPGSRSTYGELLSVSGLSRDAQDKFAPVYLSHRGDSDQLWDEAGKAGLNQAQIGKLKLQGKLAFLTGNSEGMTARLMGKQLDDPVQMVEQDFHRPDSWVTEVFEQAGIPANRRTNLTDPDKKKLADLIPAAYADEKVEDRLEAYAEDMSRKVRLSYPTQVVGRLIEQDEIKLPEARDATVQLLKNAVGQGFRLGETPVDAFLTTHADARDGMADADFDAAQQQLKTLQRVYQITPNHEAMPVLLSLGITSALDAMEYPDSQFAALYDRTYEGIYGKAPVQTESRLIYRKAKQVKSVTHNLFTIAQNLNNEPRVAAMSAPAEVREGVRNELIKQFPTMESLFGSMDFCECEHCRSVLSPAAYLVDLLQFVDVKPEVWTNFLAQWKETHGKKDYPYKSPYDALTERRPDLPHLLLTCENTHTALPYIDVANEILEYYVANGKLDPQAAHDTGAATTADLLAEPQNVIEGAYDKLREARYPLALPFDLWIETVRQFSSYFETPLAEILEVFRPNDDLFAPAQPFDRSAVFMESLGLSPAEVAIFTDADPLANDKWKELYGFPTARLTIQNPKNAGHATLTVANGDAKKFREGLVCRYFDSSAQSLSPEAKTISTIGASGSGGVGQAIITFVGVWTAPPDTDDLLVCDAATMLSSAKTLSRWLGVTYKEITEIVEAGFVNPQLTKVGLLYRLGVSVHDAQFYLDHKELLAKDPTTLSAEDQKRRVEVAAFLQEMERLAGRFKVPISELESELQAIPFEGALVLADPVAGGDFDLTTLRYANGAAVDATALLRINLFVRIWRKLGWSIEETDRALQAFVPRNTPFEPAHLGDQPLKTALIYLAHLKSLNDNVLVGKQSRLRLITLWSDISTTGRNSLYAQLFLTPSVLRSAPIFDHPLGHYLSVAGIKLRDHLLALQGALGLTSDEINRILLDSGLPPETAELSLPNVSLLYRHGLLAKALKLSVRQLIALKQLSGLDPFTQLHPDPLADTPAGVVPPKKAIELDHPFSQTLRFVEVAEEVSDSGLTIEDLEYLLRHRFDETGKYRPDHQGAMVLLKTLAEGVHAIRTEHAVPDDPGAMSDEVLRQKLGLSLAPDVVERFLAMMNGTAEFATTQSPVVAADQLHPMQFVAEPAISQMTYDLTRQQQTLVFRGVLYNAEKAELEARLNSKLTAGQRATFAALLDQVQSQAEQVVRAFYLKHLEKREISSSVTTGFLDPADSNLMFNPALAAGETEQDRARNRRTKLANAFLPFLQQRLIRQLIVRTMTAHTGADPVLVESLLTDERLLAGPEPLLDAFAATGERGVTATFFASTDGTGPALAMVSLSDADTGLKEKDGKPVRPAGASSARIEGLLEVPTPGAYRFFVALDKQNAEAELSFAELPNPFPKRVADSDNYESGGGADDYVELKPGVPYRFTLNLRKLNGGEARLLVQGATLPKDAISQLTLYPLSVMDGAERVTILLTKVLQLVQGLGLSEREIRYVLTHASDFGGLNLSQLPTRSLGETPAESVAATERFTRLRRLVAYARLKRDLAGGTDDLIGIFEANGSSAADRLDNKVYPLIATITRRDLAVVRDTAKALVAAPATPAFESENPMQRLWKALQVVERLGVPVGSLLKWPRIVSPDAGPDRRAEVARDLKEAIKARLEPETWQRVAQPIFDRLRQRQRDGLAAYVMHQHGFARLDELYEYFLIDPGMEPVVQTSRIRLAIASVQLFIQRCLLNMESQVLPSVINSRQWEWMKRYRVWEANRKIFLFPENWLEPEFRDDKTHLFAELEGALLQGDVSSDLVEDAFLNYLRKLDELARLDIVAMHLEDNRDPALRILHVIGRTFSQAHKYFYRRYAHQMWTSWEPVSAEIEGDHLAPVVWRDRLHLFWVTSIQRAEQINVAVTVDVIKPFTIPAVQKVLEVQLHWSEYLQGTWSPRESGDISTSLAGAIDDTFDPNSMFIHVTKEPYENDEERGVYIHLSDPIDQAFYLATRNSVPEMAVYESKPEMLYSYTGVRANRYSGDGSLQVEFRRRITTDKAPRLDSVEIASILQQGGRYAVLPCDNDIIREFSEASSLIKPIFYQDNAHTLFVEPSVTERKVVDWEGWLPRPPQPEASWLDPDWRTEIVVIAETKSKWPTENHKVSPGGLSIDSVSIMNTLPMFDWLVNPGTALLFDGLLIGPTGQPGLEIVPAGGLTEGGPRVNVNPGSAIEWGSAVVRTGATTFQQAGLTQVAGGLNVVGGSGFNSALKQNFTESNRAGFGAGMPGASRVER